MRVALDGHAEGHIGGQRDIEVARPAKGVVVAVVEESIRRKRIGVRLESDDVDHAAGGVAAVEAALCAFQHLDALDIHQIIDHRAPDARHIVDVGGDARVRADEDAVADTANEDLRVPGALGGQVARRYVLKIDQTGDALLRQRRSGECLHRVRYLQHAFLAALGGHHDLFESIALGLSRRRGGLLRQGRCRHYRQCQQGRSQQKNTTRNKLHDGLPLLSHVERL